MEKEKLVPELRFPEFTKDWEEKLFDDIATFSKGKGISKLDIALDGSLECIRYGELYTHYSEVIENIVSRTNLDSTELILSEKNDVIIPASGETQIDIATASCVLKDGVALGGDLNIIKSPINGVFLSYYLNNAKKNEIASLAQGISVVHLYSSQLKTLRLNLPEPEEQYRIATFLTAIDKCITLLVQKKEKLELYKKGVMQKIFNQEIRFNEFKNNWNYKKLKDVSEKVWIGLVTTMTKNYTDSGVRLIRNSNIRFNKIIDDEPIYLDKAFADQFEDRKFRLGDIATVHTGDVGTSAIINEEFAGAHGFATLNTRVNSEILDNAFLCFYFNSEAYKNWAINHSTGDGRNNLNIKDFVDSMIPVPEITEQKKIAEFLSYIDNVVNKIDLQIKSSNNWKKGLLQKMFV